MSNKELRARALDLSAKLGESTPDNLDSLDRDGLLQLVAGLEQREKVASDAGKPPAGSDAPKPPEPQALPGAVAATRYFVAEGKSLSCARGILGSGEELAARDISGLDNNGKLTPAALLEQQNKQLEYLAKRGHVVRR